LAGYAAKSSAISIVTDDGTSDPQVAVEEADVAIVARPDDVAALARSGLLLPLDEVLSADDLATVDALPLADLGRVEPSAGSPADETARLFGAPIAATASSLLWYPADAFAIAGYKPPRTWGELEQLVEQMIQDGRTPWCLGLLGGEHDGAYGADLIEDLVLERLNAIGFDRWASGRNTFALVIQDAFQAYQELIHLPGAVWGGPETAVRMPAAIAALQMGSGELPECWLVHASGDQRSTWAAGTRDDLTPIRFPVSPLDTSVMRGRAYTLVVVRDRPEVRAFVRYLVGKEFATQMVSNSAGSGLLPLASASVVGDRSPGEQAMASLVQSSLARDAFRVDASDRMPRVLGALALPDAALRIAAMEPEFAAVGIASELNLLERTRLEALPEVSP